MLLQHKQERAILRINGRGTERLVDRDREAETVTVLSRVGLCQPLYCQFENGVCFGYAPGRPLQLEDVAEDVMLEEKEGEEEGGGEGGSEGGGEGGGEGRGEGGGEGGSEGVGEGVSEGRGEGVSERGDEGRSEQTQKKEDLARKIAAHMVRLHSLHLPASLQEGESLLWTQYDRWLDGLSQELLERIPRFCSEIGTLEKLKSESRWLQEEIAKTQSPIVFCHSDINKPNVIFDECTGTVTFVDFEYAGPNYLAFDLANWLCETNIESECYPSEQYCRRWIALYIKEVEKLRSESCEISAQNVPDTNGRTHNTVSQGTIHKDGQRTETCAKGVESWDLDVASVQWEVGVFSLASHMLWCVWALHQATHSEVDFDFVHYAILRHSLFVKYREQFAYSCTCT